MKENYFVRGVGGNATVGNDFVIPKLAAFIPASRLEVGRGSAE